MIFKICKTLKKKITYKCPFLSNSVILSLCTSTQEFKRNLKSKQKLNYLRLKPIKRVDGMPFKSLFLARAVKFRDMWNWGKWINRDLTQLLQFTFKWASLTLFSFIYFRVYFGKKEVLWYFFFKVLVLYKLWLPL